MTAHTLPYIGRFAPSPTGHLHFGSLVAAVASYLDAKSHQGQWLVRMEDLDPPREEAGAADAILKTLEAHHLYWDQPVLYQSQRHEAYGEALSELHPHVYPCDCTRQRIRDLGGMYDNHCRNLAHQSCTHAIRIRTDRLTSEQTATAENINDVIQGPQHISLSTQGDFILRRKDNLFAYQLAAAVDDRHQNITHVIRGLDLLDSTPRQRYLLLLLGAPLPEYGHTPLALADQGHKLSKQHKSPVIDNTMAAENLHAALHFLGHPPPTSLQLSRDCEELLKWAIAHWQRQHVPRRSAVAPTKTGA